MKKDKIIKELKDHLWAFVRLAKKKGWDKNRDIYGARYENANKLLKKLNK